MSINKEICIRELTHTFSITHTTHSSQTSDWFISGNTTASFKTNRAITIPQNNNNTQSQGTKEESGEGEENCSGKGKEGEGQGCRKGQG